MLFKGPYIYFMFYLLIMVWLIPPILLRNSESKLRISREPETNAIFFGERMQIKLKVENNSRFPLVWLKVKEACPRQIGPKTQSSVSWVISLRPGETRTLEYTIHGGRRGAYVLGPLKLELGDIFGLYKRELEVQLFDSVTVYPRVIPIEELGLTSTQPIGNLRHPQRIYEDPLKIAGLRDYKPGDPPKHISWKSSAKQEKLMVRQYEATMTLDTMILLDLDSKDYFPTRYESAKELAITVAASIAAHLTSKRQAIGLATNGVSVAEASAFSDSMVLDSEPLENVMPRKGQGKQLLEILSCIEGNRNAESFINLSQRIKTRLPWGTTIVVIVPRDTEEIMHFTQSLIESGYKAVIIAVEGARFKEYLGRSQASSLILHQIREEDEISALERKREA
ncbi:MAG: DUF58 domain-containing protein [Firmicutes bacterium]|nr:DUF58 domain-containing protein [Bacillota bacterium]MDD4694310.1 DUF58 domain-containing protein [Bacillota bacterium]